MVLAVIVEDDPMVMEINRQYMERIPEVRVIACCRNGNEAIRFLNNHTADILIVDMFMPQMTGIDLLRELRSRGNSSDVIMVTADNSVKSIKEAMSLGISDYLIKPFEFDRFRTAVEKCITRRALTSDGCSNESSLSQEEIGRLMQGDAFFTTKAPTALDKGIQASTLEVLIQCLSYANEESMDCEELAKASGLSKVTVRRYMNYLIENDQAESITDYRTGGRPAIRYRIRSQQ